MVPRSTELADVVSDRDRFHHDVFGIVSPLDADNWESTIKSLGLVKWSSIPNKLRFGFSIGNLSPILHTDIPPNHPSASLHPEPVKHDILSEVKVGRMAGPFTTAALEHLVGCFRTSPLGVVEKSGSPGKLRIIRDLSWKGGLAHSVNDEIDSDDWPTRWDGANLIAGYVSTA